MSYGPNVIHECPPHRRIDADGHPTVTDLEDWIRTNQPSSIGLLVVERKAARNRAEGTGRGLREQPVHHETALTRCSALRLVLKAAAACRCVRSGA